MPEDVMSDLTEALLELVRREVSPPDNEWRNAREDDRLKQAVTDALTAAVDAQVRAVLRELVSSRA